MICSGKKLRLWLVILTLLTFIPSWAPTDFVRPTTHRRGAVRLAAAGETWWCQRCGKNGKLKDCFEASMQVDAVLLLKNYDTYQTVRELGIRQALRLYKLQFYVRKSDLDVFAARLAAFEQRPTVAYITAAFHSGKSASVLVGFLRSSELDSADVAQLNVTHYLYMPFANNGGNYHEKVSEASLGCGLHEGMLQGTSLLSCLRKKHWQTPEHILKAEDTQELLEKEVSNFMQSSPKGVLVVHVHEHRSMYPDPDFRRGAMRALAELPGVTIASSRVLRNLPTTNRKTWRQS